MRVAAAKHAPGIARTNQKRGDGAERQFRREEVDIIGGQAGQDRADEAGDDRAEAANDQNDKHQGGYAVADQAAHHGLILRPHPSSDASSNS